MQPKRHIAVHCPLCGCCFEATWPSMVAQNPPRWVGFCPSCEVEWEFINKAFGSDLTRPQLCGTIWVQSDPGKGGQ